MGQVKNETALEKIKRRRDEWERRADEDRRDRLEFSAIRSAALADGLELAIEILESKGE